MDHKENFKHKADSVQKIKEKRGQEVVSLRKEKREKIVSSKRFRHEEGSTGLGDGDHGFTEDIVMDLCKKLQHGANSDKLPLLQRLRQACAQGTLYIDAFFRVENSLSMVVGLLTGSNIELQEEAAWCLANITAGTHDHSLAVSTAAAPYLITFLSSSNAKLQDQSAWVLGNIAGDSPECRNMLHTQGVVPPLVKLLQSPVPAVVQSSAFALSNIARESPEIARELVQAGMIDLIPPFMNLQPENRAILAEVAWILTYLTTTGEHVPAMLEKGLLTLTVDLLVKLAHEHSQDAQTVTPLLRSLGNICSGPDENTLAALENPRLLITLGDFLDSTVRHIVKETLWVFSNIVGEPVTATSVAVGPLLPKIVEKLSDGFDIKQEAMYVLNNIACHGADACNCLIEHRVLQGVVPILKSHDVDLLRLSLCFCEMMLRLTDAAPNLFEQCEGVARLEGLEYHDNPEVAARANELLETYFLINNEESEDVG